MSLIQKPPSVRHSVACLWVSAGLAAVLGLLQLSGILPTPDLKAAVATGLITVALLALVCVKVGAGRNWARWFFVGIYALGSVSFAVAALLWPQAFLSLPPLLKISAIGQFALQTAALVLMFTKPANVWFRASRH
jgi:hypothetical protein